MFNKLFVAIAASLLNNSACAIVARNAEICADPYARDGAFEGWHYRYQPNACPAIHNHDGTENWLDLHLRRCESNRVWHIHTECFISPFNGKIAGYFIGHTPSTGWKLCAPFKVQTMGDHLSAYWLRRVANILRVSAEELGRQICDVHDTGTEDHWVNMTRKSGRGTSTYSVSIEYGESQWDSYNKRLVVKVWHALDGKPIGDTETLLFAEI